MQAPSLPMVSCIMPTYNRRAFIPHAIRYFQRQDYPDKELIIIDDGSDPVKDLVPDIPGIHYYRLERKITLGEKMNIACGYAKGTIIVNWDDDDWYADWRLTYQVSSLQQYSVGVCGINKLLYYDLKNQKAYCYIYPPDQRVWLLGSSLCYTKELWARNRFAEIDVGMDGLFVWNTAPENVAVLEKNDFSVHMIHESNVSPKKTSGAWWHHWSDEEIQTIMGSDWHSYALNGKPLEINQQQGLPDDPVPEVTPASFSNIYACLVHERSDCIEDLVRNLYYNDPASVILLYNGSNDPGLIPADFPYASFNAVIHPNPIPAKHGYLHRFALDCMEFALDQYEFDCLTIVDSDQLCIRKGYPAYLAATIGTLFSSTGMLSSNPDRIDRHNKKNYVALQAFSEYELWKPFLEKFDKGEEKFVHWTFWPSAVFMRHAVHDLVQLFKNDTQLQHIMEHTGIWASEEVILPTLVRLLGYEIRSNPCEYDLVRYKLPLNVDEIKRNVRKQNIFWIHPVKREFDDPVRKWVREWNGQYDKEWEQLAVEGAANRVSSGSTADHPRLLAGMNKVYGWLSIEEARLLMTITHQACSLSSAGYIIEAGSYHGKATVLMGAIVKKYFPDLRIVSVDPHDGKQGAVDLGLKTFPPSLPMLQKNILEAGIAEFVKIVQARSYEVPWDAPISLLVIDGLHDYQNVSRDFYHFSDWIIPGGYVAFHDYADYFPGVKKFVDEVLLTSAFKRIEKVESMIVLRKNSE
ncbi:MAG: glycosyltransferase [Chitinophagaceae bacterium]